MSSICIRWFTFSCGLVCLYPVVHFQSLCLNGFNAIKNRNGDRSSPWNITFWFFVSAKLFPPAVNSTRQVFMVFVIKFMNSSDIFFTSSGSLLTRFVERYHMPFYSQSKPLLDFSVSSCSHWR